MNMKLKLMDAEKIGHKKGLLEGRSEAFTTCVKNMLMQNKSMDEILIITGLSEEEVREIQDSIYSSK